jgi:hypothetical protein
MGVQGTRDLTKYERGESVRLQADFRLETTTARPNRDSLEHGK